MNDNAWIFVSEKVIAVVNMHISPQILSVTCSLRIAETVTYYSLSGHSIKKNEKLDALKLYKTINTCPKHVYVGSTGYLALG